MDNAMSDDLISGSSLNYSLVAKKVISVTEKESHKSLEDLTLKLIASLKAEFVFSRAQINVWKPKSLLLAESVSYEFDESMASSSCLGKTSAYFSINRLTVPAIVGINPWERERKQNVLVNLRLQVDPGNEVGLNYRSLGNLISDWVTNSSYKTVEALAQSIINLVLDETESLAAKVQVLKPSALSDAEFAGVEISRTRECIAFPRPNQLASVDHFVYLGIGSNEGDRLKNIHCAIDLLSKKCGEIVKMSNLYESEPMYMLDQEKFFNAVVLLKTRANPEEILNACKEIEKTLGRKMEGVVRNGPRTIDLDILLYDDLVMNTENLAIPHPLMQEREFVLKPLSDLAYNLYHPKLHRSIGKLLNLLKHQQYDAAMEKQLHPILQIRNKTFRWDSQTYLMGILNVTPDSFSDGNQYFCVNSAVERAKEMIEEGVDILDIGGMSTRPGSEEISEEEEIARVIPAIREIRLLNPDIPISVDTYRANVAEQAVLAGADVINDISGGTRDKRMLEVMAALKVPVCLMHMRGDAKSMSSMTDYSDDIHFDIRKELNAILKSAFAAGIYRWNIILDPGIGFAKNHEQNVEILKNLGNLTKPVQCPDYHLSSVSVLESSQYPWLIGTSRKGFIGAVTGEKDASKRDWGTASTVCSSIQGGANIIRVHNVKGMKDVLLMADRLFRSTK